MFEPSTLRHYRHELRAMLAAAADQDPEGLIELESLIREALHVGIPEACAEQRRRQGWSWANYGRAAGITPWAAQKRFDPNKHRAR